MAAWIKTADYQLVTVPFPEALSMDLRNHVNPV